MEDVMTIIEYDVYRRSPDARWKLLQGGEVCRHDLDISAAIKHAMDAARRDEALGHRVLVYIQDNASNRAQIFPRSTRTGNGRSQ